MGLRYFPGLRKGSFIDYYDFSQILISKFRSQGENEISEEVHQISFRTVISAKTVLKIILHL